MIGRLDNNKVISGLFLDIEIAITKVMPWKLEKKYIDEAMVKIRAIIKPAMERDDCKIRDQAREIACCEEKIEELSESVDQFEGEEIDREEEAEHRELVNLFYTNTLAGKEQSNGV